MTFGNILVALETVFGMSLMLTIMFAGLLIMFKPARSDEILKNTAIAAGLFLLGLTFTRTCVDALR